MNRLLLLSLVLAGPACSTLPDRPDDSDPGIGGYALSRNQACLLDAERAYKFGKYDEAQRALGRWQGPMEDPRPLVLLARCAVVKNQFGYAAELFSRAQELAPRSGSIAFLAGQAWEAAGHWSLARDAYQGTLAREPLHAEAALGSLRTLVASGNPAAAYQEAVAGCRQFGNQGEYLALAADLAFSQGQFEQCITWSDSARLAGSNSEGLEERLLLSLAWTGAHDRALALAMRPVAGPRSPITEHALARSELALGKSAAAESRLRQLLDADPGFAAAWADLAGILFLRGQHQEALAAVDEALRANPDLPSATAQLVRAHSLLALGRGDEAGIAFCEALARGADSGEVQPYLDGLAKSGTSGGNSLQPAPASSAKGLDRPSGE